MNNNTPTLDEQLNALYPEFRTVQNPTRKEVIIDALKTNSTRIHDEWAKSEPNLTLIDRLTTRNAELRKEFELIETIKN